MVRRGKCANAANFSGAVVWQSCQADAPLAAAVWDVSGEKLTPGLWPRRGQGIPGEFVMKDTHPSGDSCRSMRVSLTESMTAGCAEDLNADERDSLDSKAHSGNEKAWARVFCVDQHLKRRRLPWIDAIRVDACEVVTEDLAIIIEARGAQVR